MKEVTKWLLIVLVVVSAFSLTIIYQSSDYIAEVHMAKALPLAIVAGLSAIALAIHQKA